MTHFTILFAVYSFNLKWHALCERSQNIGGKHLKLTLGIKSFLSIFLSTLINPANSLNSQRYCTYASLFTPIICKLLVVQLVDEAFSDHVSNEKGLIMDDCMVYIVHVF